MRGIAHLLVHETGVAHADPHGVHYLQVHVDAAKQIRRDRKMNAVRDRFRAQGLCLLEQSAISRSISLQLDALSIRGLLLEE